MEDERVRGLDQLDPRDRGQGTSRRRMEDRRDGDVGGLLSRGKQRRVLEQAVIGERDLERKQDLLRTREGDVLRLRGATVGVGYP